MVEKTSSGEKTNKQGQQSEPWLVEQAREVLRAIGKLNDFSIEDMDPDELREKVQIVARSKRMREPDLFISRLRFGERWAR